MLGHRRLGRSDLTAPEIADLVYDVSQVMSFVATHRHNTEERVAETVAMIFRAMSAVAKREQNSTRQYDVQAGWLKSENPKRPAMKREAEEDWSNRRPSVLPMRVRNVASFVLAISAKRQAKKAATLGFRVEAINHLRAVLSDINDGGITSRTVDTIHDALRSTELVFSRDVREKLHRASATIFRLNTPTARRATHYPKEIIGLKDELQTDWPPLRGPGGMLV